MEYLTEINLFERWLETNYLPSHSQLLWYKLMVLFNRSGWAEWVTVDNCRLMGLIQVKSEKSFIRARDALIDSGLIEYQKGKKGSPNKYKLISCTVKFTVETTVKETVKETDINKDKDKTKTKTKTNTNNTPIIPYGEIVEYFNCLSFPDVRELTETRKKAISSFLKAHTIEDLYLLFDMAQGSRFLTGDNSKGWKANFDWILKPANAVKILEGNYANRMNTQVPESFEALKRFMEDESIE